MIHYLFFINVDNSILGLDKTLRSWSIYFSTSRRIKPISTITNLGVSFLFSRVYFVIRHNLLEDT